MKWIEVNIERSENVSMDDCLVDTVGPTLEKFGAKVKTWHFLWEGKPFPCTLMLRFFGDDEDIGQVRHFLESELKDIPHCYGAHGDCGEDKEYKGEADGTDGWGTKAWERGLKFLQTGSEFALELIENRDVLGRNQDYKKDAHYYADRYTHLFLNQIKSLINETDFDLSQGIFRFGFGIIQNMNQTLTEQEIRAVLNQIVQPTVGEVKQRVQERIQGLLPATRS